MSATCKACGKREHTTAAEREVAAAREHKKRGGRPGPLFRNPTPSYSKSTPPCARVTNALFKALRTVPMDGATIKDEINKAKGGIK